MSVYQTPYDLAGDMGQQTDPYGFNYAGMASPYMAQYAPAPQTATPTPMSGADAYAGFQASPFFEGDFTPPSAADALNDPGYQFTFNQGLDAVNRSAAGRGLLGSSGTLQDITNYGQQAAAQQYGNVYNRALQTYQANRDTKGMNFGTAWQYLTA